MTSTDDNIPTLDERMLDMLVDGELTEPERKDLLLQLDSIPGAWRRCAMAFLEAQCWREALVPCATAAARQDRGEEPPRTTPPAHAAGRRRPWLRYLGTILAMAASFLVALGLGFLLRTDGQSAGPGTQVPGQVAAAASGKPEAATLSEAGEVQPPELSPPGMRSRPAWHTVAIPVGNGGRSVSLPATERESLDGQWLETLPSAVPFDVLEALEQSGHHVELRRRLLPFQLRDGRQLVVPVDQLDVHWVGNAAYQ